MATGKASSRTRILTFRVRRVPAEITKTGLADFLENAVDGGLGGASNIHIGSLARSPDDWNIPAKQTATLSFTTIPHLFNDESRSNWVVPGSTSNDYLLFDIDFLGFTPLNSSEGPYEYDCIAVSGLASHPFGSWRQHEPTQNYQFMWLRDQLPNDFPKLRVMLYGYNTMLSGSQSSQEIDDLARSFIAHLKAIGRADFSAPPLIVFAHSLGGVVVKRALFYLANSGDTEDFMLSRVKLAIFFGVPNKGMKIRHLRAMVKDQPNDLLVESLSIRNPYLKFLDDAFCGTAVFRSLRLISVYETKLSATAELQSNGKWDRTGPLELLVSRESAISRGSKDPHDIFHIDRDHSNLVKFSPDELSYLTVRTAVLETLQPVQSVISTSCSDSANSSQQVVKDNSTEPNPGIYGAWLADNLPTRPKEQELDSSAVSPDEHEDSISETLRRFRRTMRRGQKDIAVVRNTLTFKEAYYRYNAIEPAQEATFDWVLGSQVSFMDWILTGSKVYWIRGKPGSGKSTLMKFLRDNREVQRAIANSDFATPLVDLWYFFNVRGDRLQKTLSGLLRTILCGLIDQQSLFASLIADVYYSQPTDQRDKWSTEALNKAFSAVIKQKECDIKLLIFLDALDEYQGVPEVMCNWIQHLVSISETSGGRTKVKICFSSRPWDSFLRAFDDSPGFSLHLHTMQDMKYYTRRRLVKTVTEKPTASFSRLVSQSRVLTEQVVGMIAQGAEGVFLWVALALDEITTTPNIEHLEDLELIITHLPARLEELYLRTISRIAKGNRYRAFVMLELVLKSPDLMSVGDLFFASSCVDGTTYAECKALLAKAKSQDMSELELSRNLLNLCNGLLECVPFHDNDDEDASTQGSEQRYVQFIHRTAKDFVGSPGFVQIILGREQSTMSMNGYTFCLKYEVVKRKGTFPRNRCVWLAHMDEKTNGRPLDPFVDSMPIAIFEEDDVSGLQYPLLCTSPFIFGVMADLRLYVHKALSPQWQTTCPAEFRDQNPHHVIAWAAVQHRFSDSDSDTDLMHSFDRSSMSAMLLESGFDIHERVNGLKPFEVLFSRVLENLSGFWATPISHEMVSIARTFLKQGGQNPDSPLCYGEWKYQDPIGRVFSPSLLRRWSALHVACDEALQMLLECGADPNVLDIRGNTPLDVWIGTTIRESDAKGQLTTGWALNNIEVLVGHGALLTERGRKMLPTFSNSVRGIGSHSRLMRRLCRLPLLDLDPRIDDAHLDGHSLRKPHHEHGEDRKRSKYSSQRRGGRLRDPGKMPLISVQAAPSHVPSLAAKFTKFVKRSHNR